MKNWGKVDLERYRRPWLPLWLLQVGVAIACIVLMGAVRLVIELITPGVAPFAMLFPAVLLATLFGRSLAGTIVLVFGGLVIWWLVWLPALPDGVIAPNQVSTLVLIFISGFCIIAVGEQMIRERRAKIEQRDMMIREINHRIGNNFQMITSMLMLQARHADNEEARDALEATCKRVSSLAEIHQRFSFNDEGGEVEAKDYLESLAASFTASLHKPEELEIVVKAEPRSMKSEQVLGIGMIVNELLTNAAKHAFSDGRKGRIEIEFAPRGNGARLVIQDNGIGLPKDHATRAKGLGRLIVASFVRQLNGRLTIESKDGSRFTVDIPR